MKKRKLFDWVIIVTFTLFLLETTLRIQQHLGPIYDLKFDHITLEGLSNVVNHKPLHKNIRKLAGSSMYGEFDGYEYIFYCDSNGIRKNSLRSSGDRENKQNSILFLGDSFMQGYDDSNTIPQHVWVYLKEKGLVTTIYNAGFYSYSPAIFIPQSKRIIPKLNPDFVVVDIDETDLGDDIIRYNKLIVRNSNGKNIAVKFSPLFYEHLNGFVKIKKQPIFIIRLLQTIYHKKIYMPAFQKKYRSDKQPILGFSRDKDDNAQDKYQKEISIFRNNVSELADTLIELMGDRHRILFLYHPHLQHLKADADGGYWNDFVSNTVKEVAEANDIAFYKTTEDLRILFNDKPQSFYWKNNIHFNFKGIKLYGELVAIRLLSLITDVSKSPVASARLE